jgi:hypothetical protein
VIVTQSHIRQKQADVGHRTFVVCRNLLTATATTRATHEKTWRTLLPTLTPQDKMRGVKMGHPAELNVNGRTQAGKKA